jgi:hypothetical protein
MSNNDKRNLEDQEIDLSAISGKISDFFQSINAAIFKTIHFLIKKIIVLGILFLIGIGLGIYLDKTNKVYDHEIILQPNFGSTDYVYSKVDLLASKIKEQDTVFLKSIGIKDPSNLLRIEIKPIVDIYKFISGNNINVNEQNFELLKLMAEDGDMKKIVEEETTSKNYAFHKISFKTNKLVNRKDIIEPLLQYINNSKHFNQIKAVYINNALIKINRNNEIISQIDGFLNSFSSVIAGNTKSDKLVYYNENTQLNDVIQTKNGLIAEIGKLQMDLISIDEVIKETSSTSNIQNTKSVNGKLKLILPLLFVSLYLLLYLFINFYKTQSQKYKES